MLISRLPAETGHQQYSNQTRNNALSKTVVQHAATQVLSVSYYSAIRKHHEIPEAHVNAGFSTAPSNTSSPTHLQTRCGEV